SDNFLAELGCRLVQGSLIASRNDDTRTFLCKCECCCQPDPAIAAGYKGNFSCEFVCHGLLSFFHRGLFGKCSMVVPYGNASKIILRSPDRSSPCAHQALNDDCGFSTIKRSKTVVSRTAVMGISLNHTIVVARDKEKTATFLTEMLGLPPHMRLGHFAVVSVSETSLDFVETDVPIEPRHFAFLVSDGE